MTAFWLTLISTFGLTKLSNFKGNSSNRNRKTNIYLYSLAVLILILVAGLRKGIGDTYTYRDLFDSTVPSVTYYLKQFNSLSEYGFWVSMAFIKQFISNNSQVFIFIYAAITIALISCTLYKTCQPSELGPYFFITMGGYLVVMNGMRQYLASAILFAAFPLIKKKKWYIYFPIVYLASTIHSSSYIMIPLYFLLDKKAWGVVTKFFLIMGIGLYLTYPITGPIIAQFLNETQYGHYSQELVSNFAGASIIRTFVAAVPVLLSYNCKNIIRKREKYGNIVINGAILYLIFTLLANKYWIYARFNIYFSFFTIILLCYVIKYAFTKQSAKIVYISAIILYLIYYYYEMVISLNIQYSSIIF